MANVLKLVAPNLDIYIYIYIYIYIHIYCTYPNIRRDCVGDPASHFTIFRKILIQNLPVFIYRCEETVHFLDDKSGKNYCLIYVHVVILKNFL